MKADHDCRDNGWGNAVHLDNDEVRRKGLSGSETYRVHGWKTPHPQRGFTFIVEFKHSLVKFELVEVEVAHGIVPDMFMGRCRAVEQEWKPGESPERTNKTQ